MTLLSEHKSSSKAGLNGTGATGSKSSVYFRPPPPPVDDDDDSDDVDDADDVDAVSLGQHEHMQL